MWFYTENTTKTVFMNVLNFSLFCIVFWEIVGYENIITVLF